jgi:hypothetical protein
VVTLSIPDHARIARGALRVLITKAGLTMEEFLEAVQQAPASWRPMVSRECVDPATLNDQDLPLHLPAVSHGANCRL